MFHKSKLSSKDPNFREIEILVEDRNFCQNRSFYERSKFLSKIKILVKKKPTTNWELIISRMFDYV